MNVASIVLHYSPPLADILCRKSGLKKAVIPSRNMELKKAEIPCRK